MTEAKVFQSGNSQAIRLPKEFRISSKTVNLNRIGNAIVITPKDDPWSTFKEGVKEADDFPQKEQPSIKLKDIEL